MAFITDGIIFILALSSVLVILWIYDSRLEAAKAFISFSFTLGSWRISVGLIIGAMALLYGALLISWSIQSMIMENTWGPYTFESGFKYSVARLVHYAIVFVAFILALSLLGFEMTKLTIMLSALGVGIGFGLRSIVSDFVSGIILLFERPVRVGDYIEFNNESAQIKNIGLRASKVRRLDKAEIAIPNSTLTNNPITNWTFSDRILRLCFPIGVAYGSDVALVRETLLGCARDQDWVLKRPEPQAYFRKFGESTLLFELRVFIANYADRFRIESDLNQEIDKRFRMAGIEIAFPQRDLHLRSVDPSIDSERLKKED
jgi:small-conductance mechanosensitive channel